MNITRNDSAESTPDCQIPQKHPIHQYRWAFAVIGMAQAIHPVVTFIWSATGNSHPFAWIWFIATCIFLVGCGYLWTRGRDLTLLACWLPASAGAMVLAVANGDSWKDFATVSARIMGASGILFGSWLYSQLWKDPPSDLTRGEFITFFGLAGICAGVFLGVPLHAAITSGQLTLY